MRRTQWHCNKNRVEYTDLPERRKVYKALLRDKESVRKMIARPKVPGPRVQRSSFSQVYDIPWNAQRQRYFQAGDSSGSNQRPASSTQAAQQPEMLEAQNGAHQARADFRAYLLQTLYAENRSRFANGPYDW